MIKLLTHLSDVIFPPSANEIILRAIATQNVSSFYQPNLYHTTVYLSCYSEPVIKAAVTENKFSHHLLAAKILSELLHIWLAKQSGTTLFIPIPLGRKRLRDRGYNQIEVILNQVTPIPHTNLKLLKRSVETLPQSQLSKKMRHKNIHKSFQFVGQDFDFTPYTQVVILDDVVTTGATLAEARAELSPNLPSHVTLHCLAIAH